MQRVLRAAPDPERNRNTRAALIATGALQRSTPTDYGALFGIPVLRLDDTGKRHASESVAGELEQIARQRARFERPQR
jgi:hypothetical protein